MLRTLAENEEWGRKTEGHIIVPGDRGPEKSNKRDYYNLN